MRRGELGMIEAVMVLVVFFFLLAVGLMVYNGLAGRGAVQRSQEALELRGLRIARLAMTFPELQCSVSNVIQENCVDQLKASAMSSLLSSDSRARQYYYDTFQEARIRVRQVYPTEEVFVIYEREPAEYRRSEATYLPVIVYDPLSSGGTCLTLHGACHFGTLIVEVYQ